MAKAEGFGLSGIVAKRTGPNNWQTPKEILDRVRMLGPIGLDPCTSSTNPTGARVFISDQLGSDGRSADWAAIAGTETIFVNPPFGRPDDGSSHRSQCYDWIPPTVEAARSGARVVFLSTMSQRVEVPGFQPLFDPEILDALFFPTGRVRYVDPNTGEQAAGTGQWPTILLFYNFTTQSVRRAFGDRGIVMPIGAFDGD